MLCPKCSFENPNEMRFCGECGQAIRSQQQVDAPQGSETSTAASISSRAERRRITVMFCDLVGSTELADRLDPEVYSSIVNQYRVACKEVVSRFGGFAPREPGDAVLAYFGYPHAHEDDAQRAVYTGLGIIESLRDLNVNLRRDFGVDLSVRVGIHTGLVVVEGLTQDGAYREVNAVGSTPNIAARIQELSSPNTVSISGDTHSLARVNFECSPLGPHSLRGIANPVDLYMALRETDAQARQEALRLSRRTPLVGRESELEFLRQLWEQAREGAGPVVSIEGEPGIGKSRLVEEIKGHVALEAHPVLECRCSAYYENSAFYPIIELLGRLAGIQREDSSEERLGKLESALESHNLDMQQVVPLFASLLSLPFEDRYAPVRINPERRRDLVMQTMLKVLRQMASSQPTLLVIEDLHWLDPSTAEFLKLLLDGGAIPHLLTVFTFRPEFKPFWVEGDDHERLNLERLSTESSASIVDYLTENMTLPGGIRPDIVFRTDGVPLFVEELTKAVMESYEGEDRHQLISQVSELEIPLTLSGSLEARLDRLPSGRDVAQLAATIGRQFQYELVEAVSPLEASELQLRLRHLVESGLVYQQGFPPDAIYTFKHSLIRDTAYQSLLLSARRRYHLQLATTLEDRFGDIVETQPEILAHHFTEANVPKPAIEYWRRAGERGIENSANQEAVGHFNKALEVLKKLPEGLERNSKEAELLTRLSVPLIGIKGMSHQEVRDTCSKALEMCWSSNIKLEIKHLPAMMGLMGCHTLRSEIKESMEISEMIRQLALETENQVVMMGAQGALGMNQLYSGHFVAAREHFKDGIDQYDFQAHRYQDDIPALDYGVHTLIHSAIALWLTGYPEQAFEKRMEAIELARDPVHHRLTLAEALYYGAILGQLSRETQVAAEQAGECIELCESRGFEEFLGYSAMVFSWAFAMQGQPKVGIEKLSFGIEEQRKAGARLFLSYHWGLLAEALLVAERNEEGLAIADNGIREANETGETIHLAELYRIKGELLEGEARHDEAEAALRNAIDIAEQQGAMSFRLRSAITLFELLERQNRATEGRDILDKAFRWFTEGFDTPDLLTAKDLLERPL